MTRETASRPSRQFAKRIDRVAAILFDLCDHYEKDQENWEGTTLLEIVHGALASLEKYVKAGEVPWNDPFVELMYDVDLDWEAMERDNVCKVNLATFTPESLSDSARTSRQVMQAFVSQRYHLVLGRLTNSVALSHRQGRSAYIFPTTVADAVKHLSPVRRRRTLTQLCEPFAIGTLLISEREATPGPVSSRLQKKLQGLASTPELTFTFRTARRTIHGSVVVVIEPLKINFDERRAYYPITVGIAFGEINSPRLNKAGRSHFWKQLLSSLSDEIADLTTWDPAFFRKAETWDRKSPAAVRASRRLLAIGSRRKPLASVGHREFEELIAELYAGLGCRVRITPPSSDGGRDVIVDTSDPIPTRTIIECKRPKPGKKIGVIPVRALLGVAEDERPSKSLLVAATGFTRGAELIESRHKWRLQLIDERRLLRLVDRYCATALAGADPQRLVTAPLKRRC